MSETLSAHLTINDKKYVRTSIHVSHGVGCWLIKADILTKKRDPSRVIEFIPDEAAAKLLCQQMQQFPHDRAWLTTDPEGRHVLMVKKPEKQE